METETLDVNIKDELGYRAPDFLVPASSQKAPLGVAPDVRDPFQHDLGRIVHSSSFRRLQAKTQVMGVGEGDFHRTRLTHSLEVGQIARGIVWSLAGRSGAFYKDILPSPELIEAVSYSHDLGHPPFGHGGERALHKKMIGFGGFEGNAQTIRILTRLEKYYKGQGIRPTRRLLLGALKYPVNYSRFEEEEHTEKPPKCFYDSELDIVRSALRA